MKRVKSEKVRFTSVVNHEGSSLGFQKPRHKNPLRFSDRSSANESAKSLMKTGQCEKSESQEVLSIAR